MGSTFNPQILVEKLAKLNNSQQSIETLSHWCIFHMNKAKQVVETWDRQFHYSRRDQRLAFLYLANDILQNSRRKGSEFVGEFWKVLPNALRDVTESGDESGRNAALRLISIWEDRKVFGSRGLILKEGLVGRHLENSNRNEKHLGFKLKHSAGNALEKIVSAYQVVYDGQLDEDSILSKCRHAITFVEKVDKEIGGDTSSGQLNESGFVEELQGQHTILRDCIEQLRAVESTRENLVFHLREALQEQEFKLDQVRNQLQLLAERGTNEIHPSKLPHSFIGGNGEQSSPVMYTRQVPFPIKSGHIDKVPKSAAAVVAAKLTASTSSAQMLTYVLSSLASDGVIGNSLKDSSSDYPSEKRPKLENDHPSYMLPSNPQAPVPPFPQPDSLQHNVPITSQESSPSEQPPPPSSPPPLPPLPPMQPYPVAQFMQTAGSITSVPYGYGPIQQQPPPPPPMPSYTPIGALINCVSPFAAAPRIPYPKFQGFEGGFYRPPSSLPMAPISRQ